MEVLDDLFNEIADNISKQPFDMNKRTSLRPCPFTSPDAYSMFFCISTEKRLADSEDDKIYVTHDCIGRIESFWNIMKHAGLIVLYSDIYECWSMPSPTINQYAKYRPLDHSIKEWGYFKESDTMEDGWGDKWAIWEIWVAVKIDVFNSKLLWAFSNEMNRAVIKNIEGTDFRTAYVNNMYGVPLCDITSLVTMQPEKSFMFPAGSTRQATCDGEDELEGEPLLHITLQSLCVSHCTLKRFIEKKSWIELSAKDYLKNMRLTSCGFEAEPLRSVEKRIHQQFTRKIEDVSLNSMLNSLRVTIDERWSSNKILWRDKTQREFDSTPFAFYTRKNLSNQKLHSFSPINDFAKHVVIDKYINEYGLQNVKQSYVMETADGTLCVALWHGISKMPITTIFIGVVFERKDIDRACEMLQFIYPDFDIQLLYALNAHKDTVFIIENK